MQYIVWHEATGTALEQQMASVQCIQWTATTATTGRSMIKTLLYRNKSGVGFVTGGNDEPIEALLETICQSHDSMTAAYESTPTPLMCRNSEGQRLAFSAAAVFIAARQQNSLPHSKR